MSVRPKPSPYVIGIDLGTTNSSASVYLKGDPQTIPLSPTVANKDGRSMPSVVQFKGGMRDELAVGTSAKKSILIAPQEVFSSVKMIMRQGNWQDDPELVDKFKVAGEPIEPEEIAAEILKALMEEIHTQETIDLKGEVERVVICVPANTTDIYRRGVYQAVALAGIGEKDDNGDVILDDQQRPQGVSLLEEPTAAAMEYGRQLGLWKDEREQTILVYDLGGGTFDVTILNVDSNVAPPKFTVIATKGIAQLGGDDFDRELMKMCADQFNAESGIDIFDLKSDQAGGTSGKELKKAQQKLKETAEEAKIAFAGGSNREEINIPNFVKDGNGKVHNLEVEVLKKDFLEHVKPLLEQAQQCIRDVLGEVDLTLDDINRVVMVGGSTKADWIKESIMGLYPPGEEKAPYVAADVDVIVSQGAAVYGATLLTEYDENVATEDTLEVQKEDIVSHHLGVELKGNVFGLVMPKGLPLNAETPVQEAHQVFGNPENRDHVHITIWKTQKTMDVEAQEDGTHKTAERQFVNERDDLGHRLFEYIGDFTLKGIPKAPQGTNRVDVTMEINRENMLKVSAKCMGQEGEKELDVDASN